MLAGIFSVFRMHQNAYIKENYLVNKDLIGIFWITVDLHPLEARHVQIRPP